MAGGPDLEAFRAQLLEATHGPCILDVSPETAGGYTQGSVSLVEADLAAALPAESVSLAMSVCREQGVHFAFWLRLCSTLRFLMFCMFF